MDRLYLVIALSLLATTAGCDKGKDDKGNKPATVDRVNAIAAKPRKQVTPEELCDVGPHPAETAPALQIPPLADSDAKMPEGSWRWFNLWATWCKPCIEEMPLLQSWQKTLRGEKAAFEVVFVSVDDSDEIVEKFRSKYPHTPESVRLAEAGSLSPWLTSLGLGENAPIPVHILVDPDDRIRCVRAGAISPRDLDAVRALVTAAN